MKKYLFPILVTFSILLQGCANTPAEIRALGERTRVEIKQPYEQAATCVLQQIDNKPNDLIIRNDRVVINHILSSHKDQQYIEIISSPMVGGQNVGGGYLVSVRSTGQNSSVAEIYVSNNLIRSDAVADRLKQQISSSCH